jgi:hypothetical protein
VYVESYHDCCSWYYPCSVCSLISNKRCCCYALQRPQVLHCPSYQPSHQQLLKLLLRTSSGLRHVITTHRARLAASPSVSRYSDLYCGPTSQSAKTICDAVLTCGDDAMYVIAALNHTHINVASHTRVRSYWQAGAVCCVPVHSCALVAVHVIHAEITPACIDGFVRASCTALLGCGTSYCRFEEVLTSQLSRLSQHVGLQTAHCSRDGVSRCTLFGMCDVSTRTCIRPEHAGSEEKRELMKQCRIRRLATNTEGQQQNE